MTCLEKINIEGNIIKFNEINNIIKCKFNKQIQVNLPTEKNDFIVNNLEIEENGKVLVTINDNKLKDLTENLNLFKVNDIIVIVSSKNGLKEHIHTLKRVKGNVSIAIKDASCLTIKEAKTLREDLKVKYINIIDFDGVLQYEKNKYCYTIEKYIRIKTELDRILESINDEDEELLKFLKVYQILGENIVYDQLLQDELIDYSIKNEDKNSNLENGLLAKKCVDSGFAEILKNSLACIGIESKVIRGKITGTDKEHFWNQVKIDGRWYNADLGSDSKRMNNANTKKSRPIYCLLSDKNFGKTHIPSVQNTEYCPVSIDRRIIAVFFKRELNIKKYINTILERIKKIFTYNKQKLLTEGKGKHGK